MRDDLTLMSLVYALDNKEQLACSWYASMESRKDPALHMHPYTFSTAPLVRLLDSHMYALWP